MGVTWEIYSQELEQQLVFTPRQGGVLLSVLSAEGVKGGGEGDR